MYLKSRLSAIGWRICLIAALVLSAPVANLAQETAHSSAEGKKQREFAAVSIRRNKAVGTQKPGAVTADGYQMRNLFLAFPLLTAYVPQTGGASMYAEDQVVGMPAWMTSDTDHYDIDAKVDEADLKDWQNPALNPVMLREML